MKKGMIIKFKKDLNSTARCWVVLPITKKDIKRGTQVINEGLYALGGMWYGKDPMKIKSYGKIDTLEHGDFVIIRNDLLGLKVKEIIKLVG